MFRFICFWCFFCSFFRSLLSLCRLGCISCRFRLLFFLSWFRSRSFWFGCININTKEWFSDRYGVSTGCIQFDKNSWGWTFDLDSNLIGLDICNGLIVIYPLSLFFSELSDDSFSDRVFQALRAKIEPQPRCSIAWRRRYRRSRTDWPSRSRWCRCQSGF